LLAGAAGLLALSCTPPYDLDSIFCQGHGQCPTGYHCDQGEAGEVEADGVCVLGESRAAAPVAMVVARVDFLTLRQSSALAGVLVTETASVARIEEAVYEDVLSIPLLIEPTIDERGETPRLRPTGANLYSAAELGYSNVRDPTPLNLNLPGLSGNPIGLPGLAADQSVLSFPVSSHGCGKGGIAGLGDLPLVLREGDVWQASPVFPDSSATLEGPAMPSAPVPQGDGVVGGAVLLAHGKALSFHDGGGAPAVDTSDVFLVLGPEFLEDPGADCGEDQCNDGLDNDGDGMTDCEDGDCEGQDGRWPGETEPTICPERSCNDGKDNDRDGEIDCDDDDCPDADANGCPVHSAEVLALPVGEDGSVEVAWDQLPEGIREGRSAEFQMTWGRTRRKMAYEAEAGVDSAVLASANWVLLDATVLDASQYLVTAEAGQAAGPGLLQYQLRSQDPQQPFDHDGGYGAFVKDIYGNLLTVAQAQPVGPAPLWPAADGSLTVAFDPLPLCRGLGQLMLYPLGSGVPGTAENGLCTGCGVATLDYRRAPLACDQVAIGSVVDGSLSPSQVLCGSFPSPGPATRSHRFTLEATAGSTYVIEALAQQLDRESGLDTKLDLFKWDADGVAGDLIGDPSDGVRTGISGADYCRGDARLVWHCQESGTYILKVEPSVDGDGGSYKLVVGVQ